MIFRLSTVLLVATVCFLASMSQTCLAATPEDDVRAAYARNSEGWSKFDAAQVASTYANDAIWQNPFGVRLDGPDQIKSFLLRLFSRDGYRAAKDTSPAKIQKIRVLSPDVVIVWSEESSTGQIEDGKPVGDRHSHYLQVFHRTTSGWLITDDMIMDERNR